jgi:hypothetical protein
MFSHYRYYDECFETLMKDEFCLIDRESWVRMAQSDGCRTHSRTTCVTSPRNTPRSVWSVWSRPNSRSPAAPARPRAACANFGEFIDSVFGEGIARLFMRPYNFKVWAFPPE